MLTYTELQEASEYQEYLDALHIAESIERGYITEGVLDSLKGGIAKKIGFIKDIADNAGVKIKDTIEIFKDKKVFKFFAKIGFSIQKLFVMAKAAYNLWPQLQNVIAEYIAETKVAKWTQAEIKKLDKWLEKHPLAKKLTGPVVAGVLVLIWLNMAFSGDFVGDMGLDDALLALTGKFSLADIFTGPDGIKLFTLLFVGTAMKLSFPWPGAQSKQFALALLMSLRRVIKK